jgi:Zn-dependent protease with chaperone function
MLYAQHQLEPMQCEGPLPNDLKQSLEEIINGNSEDDFTKKNLLGIYDIFASGKVVYGNHSWKTVDRIGRKIIEKNNLDTSVKFYILRSRMYNAFATDEGYIFATTALLANVQSEDELAFILCHELSHFLMKHNLATDNYTKEELKKLSQELKRSKKEKASQESKLQTLDAFLKEYYAFSRTHELQADSLGIELFKKAGYNPDELIKTLNNLAHPHPIFHHHTFNPTKIEPDIAFQNKGSLIDSCMFVGLMSREDKDMFLLHSYKKNIQILKDSGYLSHPEWHERVSKALSIFKNVINSKSNITTNLDIQFKREALSEMIVSEYRSGNYFHSLAYLLLLEELVPELPDVKTMKGVCLAAIYLRNQQPIKIVTEEFTNPKSFLSQLFFHLEAFESFKIRALAMHHLNNPDPSSRLVNMSQHYMLHLYKTDDVLQDYNTEDVMYFRACGNIDTVAIYHPIMKKLEAEILALDSAKISSYRNFAVNLEKVETVESTKTLPKILTNGHVDSLLLLNPLFVTNKKNVKSKYSDPLSNIDRMGFFMYEMERNGNKNELFYNSLSFDDKTRLTTESYNRFYLINSMLIEYVESSSDKFKCPIGLLYNEKLIEETGCKRVQLLQINYDEGWKSGVLNTFIEVYTYPFSVLSTYDLSGYAHGFYRNTVITSYIFNLSTYQFEQVLIHQTPQLPGFETMSVFSQLISNETKEFLEKKEKKK